MGPLSLLVRCCISPQAFSPRSKAAPLYELFCSIPVESRSRRARRKRAPGRWRRSSMLMPTGNALVSWQIGEMIVSVSASGLSVRVACQREDAIRNSPTRSQSVSARTSAGIGSNIRNCARGGYCGRSRGIGRCCRADWTASAIRSHAQIFGPER